MLYYGYYNYWVGLKIGYSTALDRIFSEGKIMINKWMDDPEKLRKMV